MKEDRVYETNRLFSPIAPQCEDKPAAAAEESSSTARPPAQGDAPLSSEMATEVFGHYADGTPKTSPGPPSPPPEVYGPPDLPEPQQEPVVQTTQEIVVTGDPHQKENAFAEGYRNDNLGTSGMCYEDPDVQAAYDRGAKKASDERAAAGLVNPPPVLPYAVQPPQQEVGPPLPAMTEEEREKYEERKRDEAELKAWVMGDRDDPHDEREMEPMGPSPNGQPALVPPPMLRPPMPVR
jgi:hypothetical protein